MAQDVCSGYIETDWCEKISATQCKFHDINPVLVPCGSGRRGDHSDDWIVGSVDGYSCTNRTISGWAVRGSGDRAINASPWINAIQTIPPVAPIWDPSPHQLTDILRNDINTYYGITGNHGFNLSFPPSGWIDGQSRTVKIGASGSKYLFGQQLWNDPITITCLPCTTNPTPSCSASGTSVDLSWSAITGASGYMVRLNRDPLSIWGGCPGPAESCDPNDIAPVVNTNSTTFTITPDTDYQFKIQGTKPGESYPFSGCTTPFTSGSASLPMA